MPKNVRWVCDACGGVDQRFRPPGWMELKVNTDKLPQWIVFCSYQCLANFAESKMKEGEDELVEKT